MSEIQKWMEQEFLPWKSAMKEHESVRIKNVELVQKNASELKYIIALLLEKRDAQAVKIWNSLGLEPELSSLKLNLAKDELVMEAVNGYAQVLNASALIEDLQRMLKQA